MPRGAVGSTDGRDGGQTLARPEFRTGTRRCESVPNHDPLPDV